MAENPNRLRLGVKSHKGFTLIEVIVILAVLAILAAIAVPVALRIFERTAEDATRTEMDNIKKAMIGDPQKLQSSFRSDFGFLGDIGCLPTAAFPSAPALDRLSTQGTLPGWSFDSTKQAGAGWKGPYITGTAGEDFTKDQWGNDYVYTAAGACPLTATLTSSGADLASTSDDITVTIVANETTATVRGKVKDTAGNGIESVPVEYYTAANNGVLTTTSTTTDASGNYSFSSAPFGPRAASALPRLVFSPGSVVITGGGNSDILFKVVNYSTSAVTITQIRADFTGGANYDIIRINGITVDSGVNFVTTQVVNVTSTVIAASPVTPPSMRVVVDSFDTQLPDITVSGQGTSATIELNSFNQNMTGIPFTVIINPGASQSVVKFTP